MASPVGLKSILYECSARTSPGVAVCAVGGASSPTGRPRTYNLDLDAALTRILPLVGRQDSPTAAATHSAAVAVGKQLAEAMTPEPARGDGRTGVGEGAGSAGSPTKAGEQPSTPSSPIAPTPVPPERVLCRLGTLMAHLDAQLDAIAVNEAVAAVETPGRLGPETMTISVAGGDSSFGILDVNAESGCLRLESHTNFPTGLGSACVHQGKWMYEVTLGTGGIQQLGWAAATGVRGSGGDGDDGELRATATGFSNEEGVGDVHNTYAYDGKRKKIWNIASEKYGEYWVPGDVIGCCIDLDSGCASYHRNGKDLGTAFTNVVLGPGHAYFPAMSLSYTESATVNFGSVPLSFPVAGYRPLQAPPRVESSQAAYLVEALRRLFADPLHLEHSLAGRHTVVRSLCFASLFTALGPLLFNKYVVARHVLPLMLGYLTTDQRAFSECCDSMAVYLQEPVLKVLVHGLLDAASKRVVEATQWQGDKPVDALRFATALLRHKAFMTAMLDLHSDTIGRQLHDFLSTKLIGIEDVAELMPAAAWPDGPQDAEVMRAFEQRKAELAKCMRRMELARNDLVFLFLDGDEPLGPAAVSPRSLFVDFLRTTAARNTVLRRQVVPPGTSDPTVLQNLFFSLMEYTARPGLAASQSASPSKATGGDPAVPKEDLDSRTDMASVFSSEPGSVLNLAGSSSPAQHALGDWVRRHVRRDSFALGIVDRFQLNILGGTYTHAKAELQAKIKNKASAPLPTTKPKPHLHLRLLNIGAAMYSLTLRRPLRRFRASVVDLDLSLQDFARSQADYARCSDAAHEAKGLLGAAVEIHRQRCEEDVRVLTVYRVSYLGCGRRESLELFLGLLLSLLQTQAETDYFQFVPEVYLEAVIDCFSTLHACSEKDRPFFTATKERLQLLERYTKLFMSLLGDERIVNPDLSLNVMTTMRKLLNVPAYMAVVEQFDGAKPFIKAILATFEGRYWFPSTDILMRFWAGHGFAYRACKVLDNPQKADEPPVPDAAVMRQRFREICAEDKGLVSSFLNQLLNHLNWAITEYDQTLQELREAAAGRGNEGANQDRYRRCSVMFELGVSMLRLLEACVTEAPLAFLAADSETNMIRVVEVMVHLLARITSSSVYDSVLTDDAESQRLNRIVMLSPIVGALDRLITFKADGSDPATPNKGVLDTLFDDPGFKLSSVECLQGADLSFASLRAITGDELAVLTRFVSTITREAAVRAEAKKAALAEAAARREAGEEEEEEDDANLCAICYASACDSTFFPCQHKSCRRCITRHLLNSKKCFFCNAEVESVDHGAGPEEV